MESNASDGVVPPAIRTGGLNQAKKIVQFLNKSAAADQLTLEWFVEHNAVCCICRTAIDSYDSEKLHRHPKLGVVICSRCSFDQKRGGGGDKKSCVWCCRNLLTDQADAAPSSFKICCIANCSNLICVTCLESNFTKAQVEKMRIAWTCSDCDPSSMEPHQLYADCLVEFARRFRKPLISDQYPVPTEDSITPFVKSIRTLLIQLDSDSTRNKVCAGNLEELIDLAQKLRADLGASRGHHAKVEPAPEPTLMGPLPSENIPNGTVAPSEPTSTAESLGIRIKSEIPEAENEICPDEPHSPLEASVGEVHVKPDPELTQPLPQRRKASSDADSNETLRLERDRTDRVLSGDTAEDAELNRLLGNINRRHKNKAGDKIGIATVAPDRKKKKIEEPFLSSDEESDTHEDSCDFFGASSSQYGGPLIVVSSDDDLLDCNSPDDDEEEFFNSKNPSDSPESSADDQSAAENAKQSDEVDGGEKTSDKAENGSSDEVGDKAGKVQIRRRTVPSMPSTSCRSPKRNKKKAESNKRKHSSDESDDLSDKLPSDLESMCSDDATSPKKPDLHQGTKTSSSKKQRLTPAVAHESESDNDLNGKRNGPSPKKFTKQSVQNPQAKKPPTPPEHETCIISSDDEDFVAPRNPVEVKTEASTPTGRRNIRELMSGAQLSKTTREANSREKERRKRIEEMQKKYNQFERSDRADGEPVKCILEFDLSTKKPIVQVHPELSKRMKIHQIEGVKFMYQNVCETVAKVRDKSSGSGAILGHCMGLGKTYQVVCLLHTLMTHPELKAHFRAVLVISPLNVIATWKEELTRWIDRNSCISDKLSVFLLHRETQHQCRLAMLGRWQRGGGIMLMTPNLLTSLLGRETAAGQRRKARNGPDVDALRKYREYICEPGPQLLVVDEGHTLKRNSTQLTQIVDSMIKTTSKILLTGTPLQNNLTEYFTMVSIVSPHLLGTKVEFRNRFEHPITNGQYKNSTATDIRKMRQRASVLNRLLETVVHRRDLSVLQSILPPRHDYVITIRLSAVQETLYEKFMEFLSPELEDARGLRRLLQDFVSLRSVWTHPKLLTMPRKLPQKPKPVETYSDMLTFDSITTETSGEKYNTEWFKPYIEEKKLDDITLGPKIFILFDIIQNCGIIGDKLVVFCTQLSALDLVEYLLSLMDQSKIGEGRWVVQKDYFRMDGQTSAEDRHRYFKQFNDPTNFRARLFLVSTSAGKLGSTLTGANRMVLLDTSWNPADDNQAVYRIYRIGQSKPVFIYRFLSFGTMEQKIYARNILKESTSHRVLDDSNMERHFTHEDVRDLYTFVRFDEASRRTPAVPKDQMLAELIVRHHALIADVHEHQQMLQNLEDDLSEEDRKIAWDEYHREKEEPQPAPGPLAMNGAEVSSGGAGPFNQWDKQLVSFQMLWPKLDDKGKLQIAPTFRNAARYSQDRLNMHKAKALLKLSDATRRQLGAEIYQPIVQEIRLVEERIRGLDQIVAMIDETIRRATLTPIPRNAHPLQM